MLSNYLNIRLSIIPRCGDDNALFLSLSGTRILQRSLEKMIKKYTTALFGETRTITANMLSFAFKNQVYNATQSVDITAKLSGSQPTTIEKIYIADIHERQAISLNL